jgi:hypothetical protein
MSRHEVFTDQMIRWTYEILMEGSGFLERDFPTVEVAAGGKRKAAGCVGETSMLCGPKGSCTERSILQCSACGRRTELFELPGRREKYCYECSADVATSILLTTEIDAATMSGEDTGSLVAEFLQLGRRLLARAQLQ